MKRTCIVLSVAASLAGCATPPMQQQGTEQAALQADYYARGKAHFAAGRLGLAMFDFQQALQRQGPSVERLNALAAAYDRLGRFDLADRNYREALALDPASVQTLNNIGYSYLLRGRTDLAAPYLAKVKSAAADSQHPAIAANLALASSMAETENAPQAARAEVTASPAPAPAPQAALEKAAAPEPIRAGLRIEQVSRGVFELITADLADKAPSAEIGEVRAASSFARFSAPAIASAPVTVAADRGRMEQAGFVIPPVIEPMPAVTAVPVAAVSVDVLPQAPAAPAAASAVPVRDALLAGAVIEVCNGSGIERSAARFRAFLADRGVPVRRLTNAPQFGLARTVLFYRQGHAAAAEAIAAELPMQIALERDDGQASDLRLRLGLDSQSFDKFLATGVLTASR